MKHPSIFQTNDNPDKRNDDPVTVIEVQLAMRKHGTDKLIAETRRHAFKTYGAGIASIIND